VAGASLLGSANVTTAGFSHFVRRQGDRLAVKGHRFTFAGVNCYDLAQPGKPKQRVERIIRNVTQQGLNTIRTWAFWDNGRREAGLRRLDHVIKKAGDYDVRLVLAMDNHWPAYDGVRARLNNPRNFYTGDWHRQQWENRTHDLMTRWNSQTRKRYKDDPTIMIWEVMNEPRVGHDPRALRDWLQFATSHVSRQAPNQLVSTGLEGFYNWDMPWLRYSAMEDGHSGNAYVWDHQLDSVDVCSLHLQPDDWSVPRHDHKRFGAEWIDRHTKQARNQVGKPVYVGEFGTEANFKRPLVKRWCNQIRWSDADGGLMWNFTTPNHMYNERDISPATHGPVTNALGTFGWQMDKKSKVFWGTG